MMTRRLVAVLMLFTMSTGAWAMGKGKGRPEPVTCPPDGDVAAALAAACPCDGKVMPDQSIVPWRNHGQYVSCVVRYRNALRKAGCLDREAKRTIARCAARSTCGKVGGVICCFDTPGSCNDPAPGNTLAEGVCSNDVDVACDTDADCTETRGRVARDEAACTEAGGRSAGAGSVCTACSTTTTTTTSTTSTTLP